jgi:hypothetical protein
MLDFLRKLQSFFQIILIGFAGFTAFAATCDQCTGFLNGIEKETKLRASYLELKIKNEDYLKKPDISPGAAIKVRSNIMLLGIKIETQDNKIEALKIQMNKAGDCSNCPVVEKS